MLVVRECDNCGVISAIFEYGFSENKFLPTVVNDDDKRIPVVRDASI